MAIRSIEIAKEEINDAISSLNEISFDPPSHEPSDDASSDEWRDFALEAIGVLEDVEADIKKIISALEG
jgi:hypothetical protein